MFSQRESALKDTEEELRLRSLELQEQNGALMQQQQDLDRLKVRTASYRKKDYDFKKLKQALDEEESLSGTLIQQIQEERAYLFDLQDQLEEERGRLKVLEEEYLKLKEIQKAIENLDPRYFVYQPKYKRHILKPQVQFAKGAHEIDSYYEPILINAGKALKKLVGRLNPDDNIKYLLIIEGMASRDDYDQNYELSYKRALSLYKLWEEQGIRYDSDRYEIMISGSGEGGIGRDHYEEAKNQRFLIQVIPKIGDLSDIKLGKSKLMAQKRK
ncbi:MAG: hypothetical protein R8P61_34225 [Bacteroidia bacterium]|nr:hypothetical protein [Bacteroidia bacterium]